MEYAIFIKILVAAVLGAVVGFEREVSNKVAGLRTHALVSLGAALLTAISIDASEIFRNAGINYDSSRIISNIVVGIGFIGAGAVLRMGSRVQGTTTAASLWVVATIGITVGIGLYKEALFATVLVYIILKSMYLVEKHFPTKRGLNEEE